MNLTFGHIAGILWMAISGQERRSTLVAAVAMSVCSAYDILILVDVVPSVINLWNTNRGPILGLRFNKDGGSPSGFISKYCACQHSLELFPFPLKGQVAYSPCNGLPNAVKKGSGVRPLTTKYG